MSSYRSFDSLWRPAAFGKEWWVLSDALFHSCFPSHKPKEKRFRLGFLSWFAWVTIRWFSKPAANSQHKSVESLVCGIPLPTPAHESTLFPFLQQLGMESSSICLLGESDQYKELSEIPYKWVPYMIHWPESPWLVIYTIWKSLRLLLHAQYDLCRLNGLFSAPWILNAYACHLVYTYYCGLGQFADNPPANPKMLVVTYELDVQTKALIKRCQDRSTRVIHIMHGQRLPTYQVTAATDLILLSKIDEPWFRERVAPHVRIWTEGHPRLEAMRREVGQPGKRTAKPRIAFFSQPFEGDYSRQNRIDDWRLLKALKGQAEVRFRFHPREDLTHLHSDLLEAGLDFVQISHAGLVEDLKWCDAVASSWSTVSMEAAACGRGIFWTCSTPERYEAAQELRRSGIGILIESEQRWDVFMKQWTAEGWSSPVLVPATKLKELGLIGDTSKTWSERLKI